MNGQKSFTLDANTMNCPKALTVAQCKVAHKWTVLVTNVKTDTTYTQTKSDVFSQTELPNPRISDILPTAGVKVGDKVTIKSSATQQYQGTYQIRWHLAKDENVDSGSHVLVASVSTTNNSKQDTLTFTMPAIPEFDGITANQEIMINVKDFLSQYSNPSKLILIPTPKPMTLTSADIDGKLSTGTVRFVSTQKFAAGTYKINVKQQENPWQKAVATTEGASSFGMLKTTFVKLPAAAYDKCAVATMCAYQFTVTGPNGVESNPITVNVIK
jgi:hypothetical protein